MYADDLVLICETKEEARQRFVAWRNELESKGLKVNISKTKVIRCARDGVPKEAAVDPCSVCGKRVGLNSIHCTTCGYWVHGRCSGVQGNLARVAQGFVCKVCRAEGRKAADEFCFKDVKLECVGEFANLGDMLNDTGGVEQAVAAKVWVARMKFREPGGILCM